MSARAAPALLRLVPHLCFALVAGALLLAAAQPILTDDLWWHLALGRAYLAEGPWLANDPLLHTSAAAPAPAAWLSDVALFGVGRLGGFQALRVVHVVLTGAVLVLVWRVLRRASESAVAASLGSMVFVALATYRLLQLRPQIATILAAITLHVLVVDERAPSSPRRVAAAVMLIALWANLHAGFMLAPAMLGGALAGLVTVALVGGARGPAADVRRMKTLAIALGLGTCATLATPNGWTTYTNFVETGAERPALTLVGDEWSHLDPFRLPTASLPPTPWAWGTFWVLMLTTAACGVFALRGWLARRSESDGSPRVDPALAALALLGILAPLYAVRFLWLAFFALLLAVEVLRSSHVVRGVSGRTRALVAAACAPVLAIGPLAWGDWPIFGRTALASLSSPSTFATPYDAGKYFAHPVWILRDAGVRGRAFNEYAMGGFMGFWLAPDLRASANGSLNVTLEAVEANQAVREHRGRRPDESFLALLDALSLDVFVGVHLPVVATGGRPLHATTAYLEGEPGWVPVFRSVDSALYVRDLDRNAESLRALEELYAREGVPFDVRHGFDVARVVREAPEWAAAHGVIPVQLASLVHASSGTDPRARDAARDRLASVYATLGLYDRAIRLDETTLRREPDRLLPRRRLVWSLLRAGRVDEARDVAAELPEAAEPDALTTTVLRAPAHLQDLDEADARALVARLPLFWPEEAAQVMRGFVPPRARPWPRASD